MPAVCLSGPNCGLCFTRTAPKALDPWEWRRKLGPTTEVDRTGTYVRDRESYQPVSKREAVRSGLREVT
jgi:hypothetical protein